MQNDQIHQTQSTYDALSRWYDLFSGPFERRPAEQGLSLLNMRPGERVLEIGCGTGHSLTWLGRRVGATGMVCGLDLSMGMLRIAQRRVGKRKMPHATLLCQGDGAHLPLRTRSIDVVWLSFVLELMDDDQQARLVRECARVLTQHGRIGVVNMSRRLRPNLMDRAYLWTHRRWPRWIDCRPIDAPAILTAQGYDVTHTKSLSLMGLAVDATVALVPQSKTTWIRP